MVLPHDDSPSIIQEWVTRAGLQAVIVWMPMGFYCGYVVLPNNYSEYHGHQRLEADVCSLDVHGGVTYSGEPLALEHLPEKYRNCFFVGFDCAHYDDVQINMPITSFGTFKDLRFVARECEKLARQLVNRYPWSLQ